MINICCLTEKILECPKYDFFYNSKKHVSLIKFNLSVLNEEITNKWSMDTIVKIKAYDEKADYIYRNFYEGQCVSIVGWIDEEMEINVKEIKSIYK